MKSKQYLKINSSAKKTNKKILNSPVTNFLSYRKIAITIISYLTLSSLLMGNISTIILDRNRYKSILILDEGFTLTEQSVVFPPISFKSKTADYKFIKKIQEFLSSSSEYNLVKIKANLNTIPHSISREISFRNFLSVQFSFDQ